MLLTILFEEEDMKKLLSVLLILIAAMAILSAGGSKESDSLVDENGLTTITFWYNPAIVEADPPFPLWKEGRIREMNRYI